MVVLGEESSKQLVASKAGHLKLERESKTELFGMAQKRVFEKTLQTELKRQPGQSPLEYHYAEVTRMAFLINFSARPGDRGSWRGPPSYTAQAQAAVCLSDENDNNRSHMVRACWLCPSLFPTGLKFYWESLRFPCGWCAPWKELFFAKPALLFSGSFRENHVPQASSIKAHLDASTRNLGT